MLGIRHLALKVRDIEASTRFYTQIMKMEVEWRPDPKNVYLTSGQDNLALHEVEMPVDGAPKTSPEPGLDHFGFLVSSPEEVDRWAEELQGQGIALAKPPKTHRDGARSFYFHDPDGNLIQLLYHPPIC